MLNSRIVDLCLAILEDHFGYYVAGVGNVLLREELPFALIMRNLSGRMKSGEAQRSLAILDQHNLLKFQSGPRGVTYSIFADRILHLIRAPRSILIIKTLYEGTAEAVFEDILSIGRTSCSDCIRRILRCFDNLQPEKVKDDFVRLADAHIIQRCERLDEQASEPSCPMFMQEHDPFLMPNVILDANTSIPSTSGQTRKRKLLNEQQEPGSAEDSDSHLLWRINWNRMERFFRDELILDAIASSNEFLDKQALRVAQLLLKVGEVKSSLESGQSNPISLQDVCRYVREHQVDCARDEIDEKLNIVGKDTTGIVRRVGDSGGGLYIINYEKGIEFFCMGHIESSIREKIGDKAVRIFRLIRARGYVEEEQVEKEAMLSSKESRELCYALMDNNFITVRQIARANDFVPARTIFLYTVNIAQVLGSMIHFTSGAIRNVIRRRMLEREKHEILLDRQLKMDVIIDNIPDVEHEMFGGDEEARNEHITEVKQTYMTDSDFATLDRFRKAERRLWASEIELEKVLFALEQFLLLKQRGTREQTLQQQTPSGRRRRQPQKPISI